MGITTGEAFSDLDPEHLEALCWAEEIPAFAEELLDQFADDWCRSQHTVDEIRARQELAGVELAEVVQLPIPAARGPRMRRLAA